MDVQLHSIYLDQYLYKEIHTRMNQIMALSNSLRNIDESHRHNLAETFGDYKFNYSRGMLTVCSSVRSTQQLRQT